MLSVSCRVVLCVEADVGRRGDGWPRVGGQYETTGHQLAAVDKEACRLHAVDSTRPARLEHTAGRPETGEFRRPV